MDTGATVDALQNSGNLYKALSTADSSSPSYSRRLNLFCYGAVIAFLAIEMLVCSLALQYGSGMLPYNSPDQNAAVTDGKAPTKYSASLAN